MFVDRVKIFVKAGDRVLADEFKPNQKVGIDIHGATSKPVGMFLGRRFDYVVTVCDRARAICPIFPGGNQTPAETWASGFRTPYGLAFSPAGELWSVEHGPRGGDELNLIEKGKNYGWPLVSYGQNYNGVPIPHPDTRPDLVKPVLYWVPVIAPGNLMFYTGTQTFPQWNGSGFIGGMATMSLLRIVFDGHGGAKVAERWNVGKRIRDVEQGPDGSLWMLEDANPGALIHVTPLTPTSR